MIVGEIMHSYLKEILDHKQRDVDALYRDEQLVQQLADFKQQPTLRILSH